MAWLNSIERIDRLAMVVVLLGFLRLAIVAAFWPGSGALSLLWTSLCLTLVLAGRLLARTRLPTPIATLTTAFGLFLFSIAGAMDITGVAFYVGRSMPMVDETLLRIDRAIGFDWRAYVAWFDARPVLDRALRFAYDSIIWQPLVIVLLLFWNQHYRLSVFMTAMVVCLLMTAAITACLPAVGPYALLGLTSADHGNLPMTTEAKHVAMVNWFRAGDLGAPRPPIPGVGWVTFPSYHATVALLCTWAVRGLPVLGWTFLLLNTAMLFATPTHGSHYLVDIIAGAVVCVAGLMLTRPLFRQPGPSIHGTLTIRARPDVTTSPPPPPAASRETP